MNDDDRITTLEPGQAPPLKQLLNECREALVAASAMGVFDRLLRCHNTRRCEWAGRQPDGRLGKKDSELPVFRYEGAPDIRVPICGKVVRWLAMLRTSVFNRGSLTIGPQRAPDPDAGGGDPVGLARIWQQTCDHFMNLTRKPLAQAFELFSTCVEELGYGMLLAQWKTCERLELVQITTQQVNDALLDKHRASMLSMLEGEAALQGLPFDPEAELPPEITQKIIDDAILELEELLLPGEIGADQIATVKMLDDRITDAEARRVIRQLRDAQNKGKAQYQAVKDEGGVWDVEALVPWVNVFHPYDMGPNGECDWVCRPRYLSEAQLRTRARKEKWHKGTLKDLLETKRNQFWEELRWGYDCSWALNTVGIGLCLDMQAMEKCPRWLVVDMWRMVTTAKGLPRVAKATFNPHQDKLLKWEETDQESLPIVVDTAEPCTYAIMAEGAAAVIADKQNFVKDSLDAEGSRGRLGSNPPLLRTLGQHVDIRPGIQMYAKRSGQTFEGSQFMQVPGVDGGHLKVVELVERLVEEYYFRGKETAPEERAMFEESVRYKSLRCYEQLVGLLWTLVQENIEELQVSRINGEFVELDARRDQLQGRADIHIGIHLDGYGEDAAEKFVKVYTQLSQGDRFGNLDAAQGMRIATELLAPTYARRLLMNPEAASTRVVEEQQSRITKILAGIPLEYPDTVSNPALRLQVLQQWQSIPDNYLNLQARSVAGQLMKKEVDWLMFQHQQQTVNPVTGRTGVAPNDAAEMGAAA